MATNEVCAVHGIVEAGLKTIMDNQREHAIHQSKMYASIAVIESTLVNLKEAKAPNCLARITNLESLGSNCSDLRVGPRLDKVEARQDKLLWGAVGVVALNVLGLFSFFLRGMFKSGG